MQEISLKNAKQYFKRNLYKYFPDDCFEIAVEEFYLKIEEIKQLKCYAIKVVPNDKEQIERRFAKLMLERKVVL